jgi:ATP-dependent Lon protease
VEALLGPPKYLDDPASLHDQVGVVTGLAWTQAGGEILHIEASAVAGAPGLILTGHLGDVMKESARAALTWVRSRAAAWEIPTDYFDRHELHIHVPAGAIPKDGPSAGVAMATALVSLATGIPVRRDVAMTGEISLRGRVLAVGGVKEKLLAAMRHTAKDVLIPADNLKDLVNLPPLAKRRMRIHPVRDLDELLQVALRVDPLPAGVEESRLPMVPAVAGGSLG